MSVIGCGGAASGGAAVLGAPRPRSSTKGRDSITRRRLEASSEEASKEERPLGFIAASAGFTSCLPVVTQPVSPQHIQTINPRARKEPWRSGREGLRPPYGFWSVPPDEEASAPDLQLELAGSV